MKAIINGKRYDTEKAEEIARNWNGVGRNDFNYIEETLYRTQKGSWFLVGDGGAMTKYSEPVAGGGRTGSSDNVVPLDGSAVLDWLERHEETEAIEKYFGDEIEDA